MACRPKLPTGEKKPPKFQAPIFVPTSDPADLQRFLANAFAQIAADLEGIHDVTDTPPLTTPVTSGAGVIMAKAGDVLRLSPGAAGIDVLLPAARNANKGQDVSIILQNSTGVVRVRATEGEVQGVASVTLQDDGLRVFRSDGGDGTATGAGGWWIVGRNSQDAAGTTPVTTAGVVLGAASVQFPNGRVATDTSSIDVNTGTPGLITWAPVAGFFTWAYTLSQGANSGAFNAIVDVGQFMQFGLVGPTGSAPQIRSGDANFRIRGGGAVSLGGVTGASMFATGALAPVEVGSDAGNVIITTGTVTRLDIKSTGEWTTPTGGASGNVLTHQGAGTPPLWVAPSGGGAGTGLQFVTYGAEATLTNERVTTASTSIALNVAVGSQIAFERAALTGAITAGANSNATLFDTNASGAGLTGGGTAIMAVGAGTGITVNANDVQLSTLAAETFFGNFTAGVAVGAGVAGTTVAGAGLTYTTGGILAVGAGTNVTVNANDIAVTNFPLTGLASQAADTFVGRLAGAGSPTANLFATMASTSIVYDAATHTFQRAALTGAVTAAQNSNATTNATTWAQVLTAGATSGTSNPVVDAGQFLQLGASGGTFPASGHIRRGSASGGSLEINAVGIDIFTTAATSAINIQCGLSATLSLTGNNITANASSGTWTQTGTNWLADFATSARIDSPGLRLTDGNNTTAGFLIMLEGAASTPSLAAGDGMLWVRNDTANLPMFTDDTNADFIIKNSVARKTAATAVSAATTVLDCCGTFTAPANTLVVGSRFRVEYTYQFIRGATATAFNLVNILNIGAGVAFTIPVAANTVAATYQMRVFASFTVLTTGAGGTCACEMSVYGAGSSVAADAAGRSSASTTAACNTTIALAISGTANMSVGVAATSITATGGDIRPVS